MTDTLDAMAIKLQHKYAGGNGGICNCGVKREHYRDHANQREWRCPNCQMNQKFTHDPYDPQVLKLCKAVLAREKTKGLFE